MMGCLNGKLDKENEDERNRREANKKIEKQLQKDKQTYRATHRLLLLGMIQWLQEDHFLAVSFDSLLAIFTVLYHKLNTLQNQSCVQSYILQSIHMMHRSQVYLCSLIY